MHMYLQTCISINIRMIQTYFRRGRGCLCIYITTAHTEMREPAISGYTHTNSYTHTEWLSWCVWILWIWQPTNRSKSKPALFASALLGCPSPSPSPSLSLSRLRVEEKFEDARYLRCRASPRPGNAVSSFIHSARTLS
jgi:hypothetical protein